MEEATKSSDGIVEESDLQVLIVLGPLYARWWHVGLPGLDGPKAVCGGAEVSSSLSAYVISQRIPQNVTLDLVTEALPLSRPWCW